MAPFIHLIADYGRGDPAFSEVIHRLRASIPDATIHPTAVAPLSTVATGFWIEQLALHNPSFDDLWVYSNTAPRIKGAATEETGGDLCFLRLDNGVPVIAVDAGFNLSFVRPAIEAFYRIETPDGHSQFRSRDEFPERVGHLVAGDTSILGPTRSVDVIPARPSSRICHVDGYGNLKTSIRSSELESARESVLVQIGAIERVAELVDSVLDLEEGELGLVPGSAGGTDPYLELFVRGGSAAAIFETPQAGDSLAIESP